MSLLPGSQQPGQEPLWEKVVVLVLGAAVGYVIVAVLGALTPTGLETLVAAGVFVAGLGLAVLAGTQVRLRYLGARSRRRRGWSPRKRHTLTAVTLGLCGLSPALLLDAVLLGHGRTTQLVALGLLAVLLTSGVHLSVALVQDGDLPRVRDRIESCRPIAVFLRGARYWRRVWGVRQVVALVHRLPGDHVGPLSMLIVMLVVCGVLAQGSAVGWRGARDGGAESASRSGGRGGAKGGRRDDPAPEPQPEPEPLTPDPDATAADPCGVEIAAGDGAPAPLARELHRVWEETGPAAGCPTRARSTGNAGAYLVEGQCRGEFWSIAVASPSSAASIALDPAAGPARRLVGSRAVTGLSDREDVGAGDFQLVETTIGPYLLIREQKTDGEGGLRRPPQRCYEVRPAKERDAVLPPGAAEVWIRFGEAAVRAWPEPDRSWPGAESHFTLRDRGGATVARIACSTPVDCRLQSATLELRSGPGGARALTAARIRHASG